MDSTELNFMTGMYRYRLLTLAAVVIAFMTVPNKAVPFQSAVHVHDLALTKRDAAPLLYRIEAYAGKPFGVGTLRYRMCVGDDLIDRSGATLLSEKNWTR